MNDPKFDDFSVSRVNPPTETLKSPNDHFNIIRKNI